MGDYDGKPTEQPSFLVKEGLIRVRLRGKLKFRDRRLQPSLVYGGELSKKAIVNRKVGGHLEDELTPKAACAHAGHACIPLLMPPKQEGFAR